MKHLVTLLLLTLFTSADYLNTKTLNTCIYDVEPYQNNTGLCYTNRSDNTNNCDKKLTYSDLIDGYYYDTDTNNCLLKNDLKTTGLTQNQWDSMLAILAHVLGFTMLFLINFLSVLVARK